MLLHLLTLQNSITTLPGQSCPWSAPRITPNASQSFQYTALCPLQPQSLPSLCDRSGPTCTMNTVTFYLKDSSTQCSCCCGHCSREWVATPRTAARGLAPPLLNGRASGSVRWLSSRWLSSSQYLVARAPQWVNLLVIHLKLGTLSHQKDTSAYLYHHQCICHSMTCRVCGHNWWPRVDCFCYRTC